jgi:hypothetical protein
MAANVNHENDSNSLFPGGTITTIARILEAEPIELSRLRPVVPPQPDQIVRRCLQKTPGQR